MGWNPLKDSWNPFGNAGDKIASTLTGGTVGGASNNYGKDVLKIAARISAAGATKGISEYALNRSRRSKANKREENARNAATNAANAAAAPGIEMARRNAIPLMVDEDAIEMARRRAMLKQAQRSGRESTMLSGGNTGGLGG